MERAGENMTEKQKLFCDYYLQSMNAVDAYQRAYKCSYENAVAHAYELMKRDEIKEYIQERINEVKKENIATIEDIMKFLSDVLFNKESKATLKDRLKAAELLGKRYAMFTEKVEMQADVELNVNIKVIE